MPWLTQQLKMLERKGEIITLLYLINFVSTSISLFAFLQLSEVMTGLISLAVTGVRKNELLLLLKEYCLSSITLGSGGILSCILFFHILTKHSLNISAIWLGLVIVCPFFTRFSG